MNKIFFTVLLLASCTVKKYKVESDSMDQTITLNSEYEVQKLPSYKRNDVVQIRYFDQIFKKELSTLLRVVAIPGDIFEIKEGIIYVNKNEFSLPLTSTSSYQIFLNGRSDSTELLRRFPIKKSYQAGSFLLSKRTLKQLMSENLIDSFKRSYSPINEKQNVVIGSAEHNWNLDNIGPILVQPPGSSLNIENSILYYGLKTYSEKVDQNYYILIADNFHASIDSRIIGLIPQNVIIGRVKVLKFQPIKGQVEI